MLSSDKCITGSADSEAVQGSLPPCPISCPRGFLICLNFGLIAVLVVCRFCTGETSAQKEEKLSWVARSALTHQRHMYSPACTPRLPAALGE